LAKPPHDRGTSGPGWVLSPAALGQPCVCRRPLRCSGRRPSCERRTSLPPSSSTSWAAPDRPPPPSSSHPPLATCPCPSHVLVALPCPHAHAIAVKTRHSSGRDRHSSVESPNTLPTRWVGNCPPLVVPTVFLQFTAPPISPLPAIVPYHFSRGFDLPRLGPVPLPPPPTRSPSPRPAGCPYGGILPHRFGAGLGLAEGPARVRPASPQKGNFY